MSQTVAEVCTHWVTHSYAALRFLHDDGEDETLVHTAVRSNGLNRGLNVIALIVAVVGFAELGAGDGDQSEVLAPHALKVSPRALAWPSLGGGAVTEVRLV